MDLPLSRIVALAPLSFENRRESRYRSDEQAIESTLFAEDDFRALRELYEMLGDLDALVREEPGVSPAANLASFRKEHDLHGLLERVRRVGSGSGTDLRVASALHDLRGGALSTVVLHLTHDLGDLRSADVRRALLIAGRDHRKMMRNVVLDLDPSARARDLAYSPHSIHELAIALRTHTGTVGNQRVVVEVDCRSDGSVAESCVEIAALDRVAYNVLNNAVRHTDEPIIYAWLNKLDSDLRLTVANHIVDSSRVALSTVFDDDAESLYRNYTTTGGGHGLRIVADLVGRAYGVADTETLVEQGYVGWRIVDEAFVTWLHWPLSGA